MRPYHPGNLKLQPYSHWRVIALAWCAKCFGVQFHISGIPFGAERDRPWLVDTDGTVQKPTRRVVLRASRA